MTRRVSNLVCLVLLATPFMSMLTHHASAQGTGAETTIAPAGLQGGVPPDFTPDEALGMDQIQSLAKTLNSVVDNSNSFATDSGLTSAIGDLGKQGDKLTKLAKGIDEFDQPLSKANLKRLAGAFGRDKAGQVRAFQKQIGEIGERVKVLEFAAWVMTVLDPASKAAGSAAAGDIRGALLNVASGICKWTVTTAAGAAGAAAGSLVLPGGGTLVGGAAAATAADKLYETYMTPLVHSMNQTLVNLKAMEQLNEERLNSAYGGIAGAKFKVWLEAYLRGDMSGPEFMALMKPHWDDVRKRNAELAKQREKDRTTIVDALRKIEADQPDIRELTDGFEKGTLGRDGQLRLLKSLQQAYGEQCKDRLSREYVRDQLIALDHAKLLQVLSRIKAKTPPDLMSCLCPAGHWYSPGPAGPCTIIGPLGGQFWRSFESDPEVWERCLGSNPVFQKKDEAGNITSPGIRIDEYIAGKRVVEDLKKQ